MQHPIFPILGLDFKFNIVFSMLNIRLGSEKENPFVEMLNFLYTTILNEKIRLRGLHVAVMSTGAPTEEIVTSQTTACGFSHPAERTRQDKARQSVCSTQSQAGGARVLTTHRVLRCAPCAAP